MTWFFLAEIVPNDVQMELKNTYNALCELLRHFWSCFPANTPFLEEKVVRMRANLEKFQFAKLNPLKQKLQAVHYNLNVSQLTWSTSYTCTVALYNLHIALDLWSNIMPFPCFYKIFTVLDVWGWVLLEIVMFVRELDIYNFTRKI